PGCEFRGHSQRIRVNKGPVISVRASTYQRTPSSVRVVVDSSSPIVHQVKPAAFGLVVEIDFSSTPRTASATTAAGSPRFASPSARNAASESESRKNAKMTSRSIIRIGVLDADDLMLRADGLAVTDLPELQDKADAGDLESETTLAFAYHVGTLLKV